MPPSKTAIAIVTFVCFTLWVSTLYFLLTYGSEPRIVNRSLDFIGPWVPAIGGVDLRKSLPKKVSDLRGGASSAAHYKPNLVKFPKVESPDVSDLSLSALSDRFAVSLESTDDFVEVLTLFALYRFEHQVPQGYRAYSMGMSLGMKDVLQNVAKIRRAALSYEAFHGSSPKTVWELLDAEAEYHSKLPKLHDPSAAIGVLWSLRQLKYQLLIYKNFLDGQSAKEAVESAYNAVYGDYHGFVIREIFKKSFNGAPPVPVILEKMKESGVKADDVREEIREFVEKVGPVVEELEKGIRDRNFWDVTRV